MVISLHEETRANKQRENCLRGKDAGKNPRKSRRKVPTFMGLLAVILQHEKDIWELFSQFEEASIM